MAQQLYPPYIEGQLPAQEGDTLCIPYQLNRAVGPSDVKDQIIKARIKQVITNAIVTELKFTFINNSTDGSIYYANFSLEEENLLQVGQYYKIQLAFQGSNYYSTVGIFKYTSLPTTIEIEDLKSGDVVNDPISLLKGSYISEDSTEKQKEYKFDIYCAGQLIESSGWQIHSVNTSEDIYTIETNLFTTDEYTVTYTVRTINNLEVKSPEYKIQSSDTAQETTLPDTCKVKIHNNTDDGYVSIFIAAQEDTTLSGQGYRVLRLSDDNHQVVISNIDFNDFTLAAGESIQIGEDFTVEQGKSYIYCLQKDNEKPKKLDPIIADFEDMLLYDGERQLKIKFNPKVSGFKITTLETKIDSIGGQYPIFYRNGKLAYKEFPISGLISYWMDDNYMFLQGTNSDSARSQTPALNEVAYQERTMNLTSNNIAAEREFKLAVLEWLNNGKPKVFRSPTEGNYFVRLMNVNLSPNDTLGRMLHTFNANAYEFAPFNSATLQAYNILNQEKSYDASEEVTTNE